MSKAFLLLLLIAASLNGVSQSGRKNIPRPMQTPPVQAPLNPETEFRPEPRPAVAPAKLSFLPETLRERQIKALNSGSFRFADFTGKVIVINLWASWCGPCRREIPEYEKVRRSYKGREVEFIGLT